MAQDCRRYVWPQKLHISTTKEYNFELLKAGVFTVIQLFNGGKLSLFEEPHTNIDNPHICLQDEQAEPPSADDIFATNGYWEASTHTSYLG